MNFFSIWNLTNRINSKHFWCMYGLQINCFRLHKFLINLLFFLTDREAFQCAGHWAITQLALPSSRSSKYALLTRVYALFSELLWHFEISITNNWIFSSYQCILQCWSVALMVVSYYLANNKTVFFNIDIFLEFFFSEADFCKVFVVKVPS